ncbi:uncharacterized protein ACA1_082190 [Acanthamoeba castellanii str. Neff]|uniref:Clu domain-containing protein n=1 Tax=Acanthamoeba castellanii (strain ATCC 30010 / Neff) TaxID=1257118 RepID=L8GQ43_ACACF|nr:uncharacterized protein ACA1_082190 [Acanthamoeba castellanii str. Neff]ELR14246.1 hypothetical protein ACA1_082190 [Acanthamoeba castellanii str. Neff]
MSHNTPSPLVALLDWWGYRLMCYSMLPITAETLAYGSADGGNTVHSGIQELNKRIKVVSTVLNLKGHWAGLAQKRFLYTCCDIEGHRGADGHYYVVDTARLFPPEAPVEGAPPTSFLYRLLRPEFVREYDRPLSSDAFSKFGEDDHQAHNQEVRNATERLKQDVIRRFADELESNVASSSSWPYPGDTLVQELHRRGINVRGLALLLNHVSHPQLRARLLSELIARAIKWDVRAAMRGKIKAEMKRARDERRRRAASPPPPPSSSSSTATGECRKCALEREMRGMVCECFRRAFADGPAELWARVRSRLCALYPGFAAKAAGAEGGEQEQVLRHLSLPDILHRVEAMLGITFASKDLKPGETLEQGMFAEEQLGGIEIRTKEAYVLPRIQADCYALLAARKKSKIDRGGPKKQEAVCYFRMAAGLYENVIKCKANDEYALYNWGLALLHGAELEGTADGAREAVAKFGACLDVCRRAVPPNHDLAALGLKAAAECLAYLASLPPTTIAGVEATNKQWLFLQADRHFSAALAILTQLSSSPSDLSPIPAPLEAASSSSSPFDAPASLTSDLDAFFSSAAALLPAASASAAAWVGGDHEDEILRLLYNWANLRRAWAAAGTSGGDDDVQARRRTLLLEASLALYQLCMPAIARWTTSAKSENDAKTNAKKEENGAGEEWSKGQEDLRAAASHIPTWYSEHRAQPTEVTNHQQPRAAKGTREEKEARDHRRRAAQVLANWGVALVELGRTAAAATPTPTPAQLRWWGEAKAKLAAAEGVESGAGAYNLGCVAALEGNADDSRRWLEKCRRDGRGPAVELWSGDNDLASVRDQAWFKALLHQPEATTV